MEQYRVVDMSNDKYIIKGISLGKNINSYFCMNRNNMIREIVIVDTDVMSVNGGQIIFSLKNVSDEWISHMVYSFCHLLMGNKYDLKNMKIDVKLENQLLKNQIEELLIKIGVYHRDVEVKKEDNVFIEGNVFQNKKEIVKEEFKPKDNLLINNQSKIDEEEKKEYVEMVSEFSMDIVEDEEEFGNSGKVALPMTLFILSIFLFVVSFVLHIKT